MFRVEVLIGVVFLNWIFYFLELHKVSNGIYHYML